MRYVLKSLIIFPLMALIPSLTYCSQLDSAKSSIKISIDPRVELMSTIARLAGYEEYNANSFPAYVLDVEAQFDKYKDHEVIKFAQKLRASRSIGYDAVMKMAIAVNDAYSLEEVVSLDSPQTPLDSRWIVADAREFLKLARKFAAASNFKEFIDKHKDLYDTTVLRLTALLEKDQFAGWFDTFFGSRPNSEFQILIGMQNGGNNYGARIAIPGKKEILYCVLGVWNIAEDRFPAFDNRVMGTIVHEFVHSYVNPLVDAHESQLKPAGEKLYAQVAEPMKKMAYGNWKTMMYETLNRACGVRYMLVMNGEKAAQRMQARDERSGFYWVGGLANLLGEYEADRGKYPNLDAFFPRIIDYLNGSVDQIIAKIQATKEQEDQKLQQMAAKSPKILSMVPPNGSQDVDPNLQEIRVTFDCPMRDSAWSVMSGSDYQGELPEIIQSGYDSTRTVFIMQVKLKSDTFYKFGLNHIVYLSFQSANGDPLIPTVYEFRTRK